MAGSDARVDDTYNKYLDACLATRVHFSSEGFPHATSNDCLFRAKNHARWLLTSIDVDEYIVYSRPGTKFYKLSKFTASLCKGFVLLERLQTK
jgi:hypothetical protein